MMGWALTRWRALTRYSTVIDNYCVENMQVIEILNYTDSSTVSYLELCLSGLLCRGKLVLVYENDQVYHIKCVLHMVSQGSP